MNITDQARDVLKQVFQEQDAKNIRVYFAGYGWGGPNMGLALDEPNQNDVVVTINEIQVAIDPDIEPFTESLTLEFDKENNGLMLVGNENSCC
jgi:iron-sulfur cluster insertion protein